MEYSQETYEGELCVLTLKHKRINPAIVKILFRITLGFLIGQALLPLFNFFEFSNPLIAISDRLGILMLAGVTLLLVVNGKIRWPLILVIFTVYCTVMATIHYGGQNFLSGYYETDVYIYVRFICMMLLGYNLYFFSDIRRGLMIMGALGIFLNIIAILIQPTFIRELTTGPILAYELQTLLIPSTFFIFQLPSLSKREKYITIGCFALYVLEQILFQKRLPLGRVFVILMLFTYGFAFLRVYGKNVGRVVINYVRYGFISLTAMAVMSVVGLNVYQYVNATFERFQQEGNISETIEKDPRWQIGQTIMDNLENSNQMLLGRGFGGVVYDQSFHTETREASNFRAVSEMGIPTILLKGGFVLLIIMALIVLRSLGTYKYVKTNQFAFACWTLVLVWAIFLYGEGFIGSMRNLNELLLAYAFGFLLRVAKLKKRWPALLARM